MKEPSASQLDAARRLFVREAQSVGSAEERADAARRLYEKIVARLATLVGTSAARALFTRSVKLTASRFPCLRSALVSEAGENLGEQLSSCLRCETPDAVTEAAVALFATLLALLGTLIGERMTAKILRDLWPALRGSTPEETK